MVEKSGSDLAATPHRLPPRWIAPAFLTLTVLTVPWTAWLVYELPNRAVANHWAIAWGGFDLALAVSLAAVAFGIIRRKRWAEIAAAIAGTMLCCDAWFDMLTSRGDMAVAIAVTEAALIELPLAGICFWIAWRVDRAVVVRHADGRRRVPISAEPLAPPEA